MIQKAPPPPATRRCLIYGTGGIGKTTWACSAPAPLLLPVEDNGGVAKCDCYPQPKSWDEAIDALRHAYQQTGYQTLVIDSLDCLERLAFAEVCRANNKSGIEQIGYGKGYAMALDLWRDLLRALDMLRGKGYSVVLIAHAGIIKYDAPDGVPYDRFCPRLNKLAVPMITEWCDEVLFASYETFIQQADGGRAKGTGDGTRKIRTAERPAWVAKNRIGLPLELPMPATNGFNEYLKLWPNFKGE